MSEIKSYIDLYNMSPKIGQLKKLGDFDYTTFLFKKGLPVAITNSVRYLNYLPLDQEQFNFFRRCKTFWMIPLQTISGEIYGFLLKSFGKKEYRVVRNKKAMCAFYGLQDLKGSSSKSIILVEGFRDALYVGRFYDKVLAMLTASISDIQVNIIKFLTKNVVIAFDSDETGIKMTEIARKKFMEVGVVAQTMRPVKKDWGEYFCNKGDDEIFKNQIFSFV